MSVTEVLELTLLVTGSIACYIMLKAAVDLFRGGADRSD